MKTPTQRFVFFRNLSITIKHGVGISLLVLLILIVALTGYLSLHYVQKVDDLIWSNTEIARLIYEMDLEMEKARHLHAGFFLYYPKIGLTKAHENYAQPTIRKTASVVSTSYALREMMSQPGISDALNKSKIDLNLYLSSAKRFADTSIIAFELVTKLAAPENGLEDILDKRIRKLKTELTDFPVASKLFHQIKDLINEHKLNRERHLMQSAFNIAFKLRKTIKTNPLINLQQNGKINLLLNQIENTAEQIIETDVKINAKFKDFALQEKTTHLISEKLVTLAKKEVEKAQQTIAVTHEFVSIVLIIVTLAGLIAAGIIAVMLNMNITHRIIRLTHTAKKMEEGHLDIVAEQESLDELGHLGRTFNFMAARMKTLIEDLEQEVSDGTLELINTNKDLQLEITEREQIEEQLREKEEFLNRVIDQSPFPTWISDANGTLQRTNLALKKVLNLTDEQLVNKYNILQDPIATRQGLIPLIRTVYEQGKSVSFAGKWTGKDIPSMNLKDSESVNIEITMFPVLNQQKKVTSVVLTWLDVTHRKRAEKEKQLLEQQLRQSHKMEAIGTLAGGIAHDFNNILSIMLGNTELAIDDIPKWSPAHESLLEIKTAGLRAKDVVRQLLNFSRKSEQNQTPQNLGTLIKESVKLLRSSIPSSIQIIKNISKENNFILADATQIHQVMLNLCTNAAHAMTNEKGTLEIHLTSLTIKEKQTDKFKKLAPGEYAKLEIKDSGIGIKPEVYEKIFDPYYTTKEFGKGTGMGLAVVHGIVKNHNGSIHVESQFEEGTSFTIFFPKIDQCKMENMATQIEERQTGTESILFVDDEPAIVEISLKIFENLGYQVKGKTNPIDAIKEFEANPDEFDLVITDMTMPQMDGVQLSRALKKIKPDIPIIICTGHSSKLNEEKAMNLGISAYAMKPISMMKISKLIRKVLDR